MNQGFSAKVISLDEYRKRRGLRVHVDYRNDFREPEWIYPPVAGGPGWSGTYTHPAPYFTSGDLSEQESDLTDE